MLGIKLVRPATSTQGEAMEIEWISKDKYCEESGFSAGRVRGWITRHWERVVQYQIHGKTTAIHHARDLV